MGVTPSVTLLLLTVFQLLVTFLAVMGCGRKPEVLLSFLGLMLVEWALFFGLKLMRRRGFDVETIAFFLTTMGFAVVATSAPESLLKEFLALCAGLVVFLFVGWTLRDLERAKVFRVPRRGGRRGCCWRCNLVLRHGEIRREKLDFPGRHVVPAVGAGEDLLHFRRGFHHGAAR